MAVDHKCHDSEQRIHKQEAISSQEAANIYKEHINEILMKLLQSRYLKLHWINVD
jgi:hypothetical protein